ncbi:MAG TPA: hypothetical protein PLB02_05725 [Thermoanaerobaculia bacterium]|nr:hypothetical protein [Thermoanaerobaculia bacterium]
MTLSAEAFEKLLAALGPDRDRAGAAYERIRLKLLRFFEWRQADDPEELADRTMDRVGRKLAEGEVIRESEPAAYVLGVARNILREHWSERKREVSTASRWADSVPPARDVDSERRLRCLDRCLATLPPDRSELVLDYYLGRGAGKIGNRKRMAERLGVAPNALRIRMHRMRAALEQCVERCLGGAERRNGSEPVHTLERKDGGA